MFKQRKLIYSCTYEGCDKKFNRPSRLRVHVCVHTGERPFLCDVEECGRSYMRASYLKRHIDLHHSESATKIETHILPPSETDTTDASDRESSHRKRRKFIKCPEPGCGQVFNKYRKLTAHKSVHSNFCYPFICSHDGCTKGFLFASRLKRHMKVHEGYPCNIEGCHEVSATWTLHRRHYTTDHKFNNVECPKCGKYFKHSQALRKHDETVHLLFTSQTVYACTRDKCSRTYAKLSSLKHHINSFHENIKFICQTEGCGKQFSAKCTLKLHMAKHTNGLQHMPNPKEVESLAHRIYETTNETHRNNQDSHSTLSTVNNDCYGSHLKQR